MNHIDVIFLKLFTGFVRQTDALEPDIVLTEKDWNELRVLSARHQILPVIYEAAAQTECFQKKQPECAGSWKRETMFAVARQIQMTSEFVKLYQEMLQDGICPLVIKGLVCRNLYPKPDYRMSADEDLLIRRENFREADHFLLHKGFHRLEEEEVTDKEISTLHEVGYRHPDTGLYLELHLSLFPEESTTYGHFNEMFQKPYEDMVCLEIEDCRIYTLSYTKHFLYLLCHNAKHFLHSGFGVRQVFDMILFAEQYGDQMDWEWIIAQARGKHLYVFLLNLLDIGVRYFDFQPDKAGWPKPEELLDGGLDSDALLEDLLGAGIFGTSSKERLHSANITLAAADMTKHHSGIWSSLFPAYSYMSRKFRYVKNHPWLLPVGWLHRLSQYCVGRRTDSREVLDTGKRRVELLDKYGLIEKE